MATPVATGRSQFNPVDKTGPLWAGGNNDGRDNPARLSLGESQGSMIELTGRYGLLELQDAAIGALAFHRAELVL